MSPQSDDVLVICEIFYWSLLYRNNNKNLLKGLVELMFEKYFYPHSDASALIRRGDPLGKSRKRIEMLVNRLLKGWQQKDKYCEH